MTTAKETNVWKLTYGSDYGDAPEDEGLYLTAAAAHRDLHHMLARLAESGRPVEVGLAANGAKYFTAIGSARSIHLEPVKIHGDPNAAAAPHVLDFKPDMRVTAPDGDDYELTGFHPATVPGEMDCWTAIRTGAIGEQFREEQLTQFHFDHLGWTLPGQ